MMQRLDKVLSNLGLGSRRDIHVRIKRGEVAVDGIVVKKAELKIDPDSSRLTVGGEEVVYRKYVYLMMNKAAGYLTATEDSRAATVLDLVEDKYRRLDLSPAGRLDKDSEGLLLLTNDGELIHKLLSPKNHVDKRYFIRYDGNFSPDAPKRFSEGLMIDGGYRCMPAKLQLCGDNSAYVTICEGKYHQVKRMAQACGAQVTYLKRISIGDLCLDETLESGQYRELNDGEEEKLKNAIKYCQCMIK